MVPDGVVAELEHHLAAAAVPIQVMKDLPDMFVVSWAKDPLALRECQAVTSMR